MCSEKVEALFKEHNERAEAATSSYSSIGDFSRYIHSVLVANKHQKIQSRCFIYKLSFAAVFNDINRVHIAAIFKKNYLRLLPFYVAVATYCY